jgi:uncharacterized membrane protein YukC
MLIAFVIACVILVYASLSVDIDRKCKEVSQTERKLVNYLNVTMLIISIVAVLYSGYYLFVPNKHQSKIASYF